ncbi:hypothetical protein [Methanosarcina sp.]|uniref:hypothetical protein n=1 Tax=Methanosarcina sp. TaxID=2213 RepID=UPI003C71D8E4
MNPRESRSFDLAAYRKDDEVDTAGNARHNDHKCQRSQTIHSGLGRGISVNCYHHNDHQRRCHDDKQF